MLHPSILVFIRNCRAFTTFHLFGEQWHFHLSDVFFPTIGGQLTRSPSPTDADLAFRLFRHWYLSSRMWTYLWCLSSPTSLMTSSVDRASISLFSSFLRSRHLLQILCICLLHLRWLLPFFRRPLRLSSSLTPASGNITSRFWEIQRWWSTTSLSLVAGELPSWSSNGKASLWVSNEHG